MNPKFLVDIIKINPIVAHHDKNKGFEAVKMNPVIIELVKIFELCYKNYYV
jgi:hypothetical protein